MPQRHIRIVERVLTRLKLKQLRLLIAVDQHRSILHASKALNLSQPAATKMIKDLEIDFEVQLFERTNRGMIPTVFGETLIRHGKLIFAQISNAAQELDDLSEGSSGRLVIGTLLAAAPTLLPVAIEKTVKERPNVTIKLVEGTNEVLMPALKTGELDMVVGRLPTHRHRADLHQIPLFNEKIILVARHGHPLSEERGLSLSDLARYGWILPPTETSLRRQLDQMFVAEEDFSPPTIIESVSFLTNRSLLAQTDFIGVMPEHVPSQEIGTKSLARLDCKLALEGGPVGISYRGDANLSPVAASFVRTLKETSIDAVQM